MKLQLSDIYLQKKDCVGIVAATGPSLKPFLTAFSKLSKDDPKFTFFCCNEFNEVTDIETDFWVIANSTLTIAKKYQDFNKYPKHILAYADTVDLTPRSFVDQHLKIDYLPFDQRHFDNKPCSVKYCCDKIIPGRKTLQEFLQEKTNSAVHYSTGDTVALHMLALSIIAGCNPIYIVGVDLDYSKGYVSDKLKNCDSFSPYLSNILNDFKIIDSSAKNVGIKIYNLSLISPLKDIFETTKEIK